MRTAVPNSGRARLVTGLAHTCFSASYTRKEKRSGSATGNGRSPATATAKTFLAAKAAPNPPRPRLRPSSVRMEPRRAPFLPDTDGDTKLNDGPRTARKPDTVRDHTSSRSSASASGHSSASGTTHIAGGDSAPLPTRRSPVTAAYPAAPAPPPASACLLYTSDAADDLLCVDLGGRRIIKKNK